MKKYHLQKISIQSAARIYLVIGLALGLIFGIITMIFWSTYEPLHFGAMLFSIFILVCLNAVIGACILAFFTWLYNLIASKIGGLEIYISEEKFITPITNKKTDKS